MTSVEAYTAVREALRESNDLRRLPWRDDPNPYAGHCYVAAEAFCALTGAKPQCVSVPVGHSRVRFEAEVTHVTHWYAVRDGVIWDPTADQFDQPVPYAEGRGIGFLTKDPSKRTRELLRRIECLQ